jgi:hypothetical protein
VPGPTSQITLKRLHRPVGDVLRTYKAWEAWSQSSDRATELRAALQGAIQAGDNSEIARLKPEVGAVLAEHRELTDEYKRQKAQRPDWKTPKRSG